MDRFEKLTFPKAGSFLVPYRQMALYIPEGHYVQVDHARRLSTLERTCKCGDIHCCCVCDHEGKCPEDGPSLVSNVAD